MRGSITLLQDEQQPLMVKDKVKRLPTELEVSKMVFSLQCCDAIGWTTGRASGL